MQTSLNFKVIASISYYILIDILNVLCPNKFKQLNNQPNALLSDTVESKLFSKNEIDSAIGKETQLINDFH